MLFDVSTEYTLKVEKLQLELVFSEERIIF